MPRPQMGDVLIQYKGEPWVTVSKVVTGHPFPHARAVLKVHRDGSVETIENIWKGVSQTYLGAQELQERFEIWRPNCHRMVKLGALEWMAAHNGQPYGYLNLVRLGLLYRLGLDVHPGRDNDPAQDNRPMICSELIAMAYYRNGYDLVPEVSDRDTMPWDLRNPHRLTRIW